MKIKYSGHSDVESVELAILLDVGDIDLNSVTFSETITDSFCSIFRSGEHYNDYVAVLKVVKVVEDNVICKVLNGYYQTIMVLHENPLCCKVNDFIIKSAEEVYLIEKDILTVKYLNDIKKKISNKNVKINKLNVTTTVTKDSINAEVLQIQESIQNEIAEAQIRKTKQENLISDQQKIYEKDSILASNNINIQKNILTINRHHLHLDQNVNAVFKYNWIVQATTRNLQDVLKVLIKDNVSFTHFNDTVRLYQVQYKSVQNLNGRIKTKIQLNDITLKNSNVIFFINKILAGATLKQLRILMTLSGIKMKLSQVENTMYHYINRDILIPINIMPVTKKRFVITYMNKTKEFDWTELKNNFTFIRKAGYSKRRSRYDRYNYDNYDSDQQFPDEFIIRFSDSTQFLHFCRGLDLTKQEIFDYLRQVIMLHDLSENNSNGNN